MQLKLHDYWIMVSHGSNNISLCFSMSTNMFSSPKSFLDCPSSCTSSITVETQKQKYWTLLGDSQRWAHKWAILCIYNNYKFSMGIWKVNIVWSQAPSTLFLDHYRGRDLEVFKILYKTYFLATRTSVFRLVHFCSDKNKHFVWVLMQFCQIMLN